MFGNAFSKKENSDATVDRILLTEEDQLEKLLYASKIKPVLLFKHSISRSFSNYHYKFINLFTFYFVKIINRS